MAKSGKTRSKNISDRSAKKLNKATGQEPGDANEVPGPSPNPATNLLINDILLRSVGRLSRMTVEKAILGRKYGTEFAKDAVENRSVVKTLAAYGVTKVATRSIPGALVVSSGLALKVLFDRSQSRRQARRKGEKTLRDQAES